MKYPKCRWLKPALAFVLITFSAFCIGSCSLFIRPTAVLWTSVPEFASYTEVYNSGQNTYKIELVFHPDPIQALLETQEPPDLIVAPRLNSVQLIHRFASLEKMYKNEELNPTVFYPQLLEEGVYEEEQVILPISFSMPMILFKSDLEIPEDDNIVITFDAMKSICRNYAVEEGQFPETMSFVTYWDPAFLFYTSYLEGAVYKESLNSELIWDSQKVKETAAELEGWSTTINAGIENEHRFTERYLHSPGYKMLNTGRIILHYTDITEFLNIPEEKRNSLAFRWYGRDREILIDDEVLFLGIPKKGKNKGAAKNFISWFYKTDTQQELLQNSQEKRIRSFGIAQGFSALIGVNERDIPRYFPEFTGRIPPKEYISLPPPLPPNWSQMKEEVLIPWFLDQVEYNSDESLEEKFRTWYLQLPAR